MRSWLNIGGAAIALVAAAAPARPGDDRAEPDERSRRLDTLLVEYFQTARVQDRSDLARRIEALADGDVADVAAALRRVQVWPMASGPYGTFSMPGDPVPVTIGSYQLPDTYDFRRAHPVIVCMPGEAYMTGTVIHDALELLGPVADESVLLCPHIPEVNLFHQTEMPASLFRTMLRHLRKRIHCDTDRVYLFGIGSGADAAWMTAINHPDLFAGVVALSGYPKLPYPEASYPLLLENLSHTPVLSVWTAADGAEAGSRRYAVAAHNRFISRVAREKPLPIRSVEINESGRKEGEKTDALSDYPFPAAELPADEIHEMLTRTRKRPREITHWFRYAAHGRTPWVEQIEFRGREWNDPQISILAAPEVDRIAYITEVLKDKLAYIGATVQGQTVDIRTRKCARVELALPVGLADFSDDITVRINGLRRRADGLAADIPTLLESAYEEWEFQQPAAARVRLSVRTDAGDR